MVCAWLAVAPVANANALFAGLAPVALAANDDCKIESENSDIPSTFPVGKCLKTAGQETHVPKDGTYTSSGAEYSPVVKFLVKITDLFTKIIASVALIVFILGALLTVSSEGKEDRLEKGKSAMLFAIIGLIVALFSFVIVTFVQSILF